MTNLDEKLAKLEREYNTMAIAFGMGHAAVVATLIWAVWYFEIGFVNCNC